VRARSYSDKSEKEMIYSHTPLNNAQKDTQMPRMLS
jgi:hypothetical protein